VVVNNGTAAANGMVASATANVPAAMRNAGRRQQIRKHPLAEEHHRLSNTFPLHQATHRCTNLFTLVKRRQSPHAKTAMKRRLMAMAIRRIR
jgi:hypothetical protein